MGVPGLMPTPLNPALTTPPHLEGMRHVFAALLILLASPAFAGAWMRDVGSGFVALSYSHDRDRANLGAGAQPMGTWHAEYGFSERLTFGAHAWAGETKASGFAFLRLPLTRSSADRKVSVELGLGAFRENGKATEAAAKLGFSFGRGLDTRWGNGWMQVNASAERRMKTKVSVMKADLMFGVSPNRRTKIMVEFQAEKEGNNKSQLTIAPTYVRRVSPSTHILLGMNYGVRSSDAIGLRLGTWLEF